jgi:hypothetical protein
VLWLVVAAAIVWGCALSVLAAYGKIADRHEQLLRSDERHRIGHILGTYAWWFSEDTPTMELLMRISKDMQSDRVPLADTDQAREAWRTARKNVQAGDAWDAKGQKNA